MYWRFQYNYAVDQKELFHRRSLRLSYYDYSQAGAYFVTICTLYHRQLFGEIQNGEMQLNTVGRLAAAQWLQLEFRFADLELGEWVIMPNHIHGILIITGRGEASQQKSSSLPTISVQDASPLRPDAAESNTEYKKLPQLVQRLIKAIPIRWSKVKAKPIKKS
jgi:REP element-mobilizing transposase RayT